MRGRMIGSGRWVGWCDMELMRGHAVVAIVGGAVLAAGCGSGRASSPARTSTTGAASRSAGRRRPLVDRLRRWCTARAARIRPFRFSAATLSPSLRVQLRRTSWHGVCGSVGSAAVPADRLLGLRASSPSRRDGRLRERRPGWSGRVRPAVRSALSDPAHATGRPVRRQRLRLDRGRQHVLVQLPQRHRVLAVVRARLRTGVDIDTIETCMCTPTATTPTGYRPFFSTLTATEGGRPLFLDGCSGPWGRGVGGGEGAPPALLRQRSLSVRIGAPSRNAAMSCTTWPYMCRKAGSET